MANITNMSTSEFKKRISKLSVEDRDDIMLYVMNLSQNNSKIVEEYDYWIDGRAY